MQAIYFIITRWITKIRIWLKDRINNQTKDLFVKKMKLKSALMIFVAGIVAAFVTALILNGLNLIFAKSEFMQEYSSVTTSYNINKSNIIATIIETVFVAPMLEEFICRVLIGGFIDTTFKIRLFTIVSSSMLFSLLHEGTVQKVYAFIFGLILSILYYYEPEILKQCKGKKFREIYMGLSNYNNKNMLRNCLFHIGFNLTGVIIALM